MFCLNDECRGNKLRLNYSFLYQQVVFGDPSLCLCSLWNVKICLFVLSLLERLTSRILLVHQFSKSASYRLAKLRSWNDKNSQQTFACFRNADLLDPINEAAYVSFLSSFRLSLTFNINQILDKTSSIDVHDKRAFVEIYCTIDKQSHEIIQFSIACSVFVSFFATATLTIDSLNMFFQCSSAHRTWVTHF